MNRHFKLTEVCVVEVLLMTPHAAVRDTSWWRKQAGWGQGRKAYPGRKGENMAPTDPYRTWYSQREPGVPGGCMRDAGATRAGAGPGRAHAWASGSSSNARIVFQRGKQRGVRKPSP